MHFRNILAIGTMVESLVFLSLIGVCLAFSLQSCTFSSDSEFFVEIDTANVVIPELDFFNESDTIYMRGNKNLRFTVPKNVAVYGVELSLSGSVIRSLDGDLHNFGIRINTEDIQDGIYSLKLSVFSKSNTNSLADQLDAEIVITEYEKICIIDNEPLVFNVNGFDVVDGVLVLDWNEYEGYEFDKYVINLNYGGYTIQDEILNPKLISYPIDAYCGGFIEGTIMLQAKQEDLYKRIDYRYDSEPKTDIQNNDLYISISENPFKSFKEFEISIQYSDGKNEGFEPKSNPVENYFIEMRKILPLGSKLRIFYRNSNDQKIGSSYIHETNSQYFTDSHAFFDVFYFGDNQFIRQTRPLVLSNGSIQEEELILRKYGDDVNLKTIKEASGVSPNGKLVYTAVGVKLYKLMSKDLSTDLTFDLSSFIPSWEELNDPIIRIFVSDEDVIFLQHKTIEKSIVRKNGYLILDKNKVSVKRGSLFSSQGGKGQSNVLRFGFLSNDQKFLFSDYERIELGKDESVYSRYTDTKQSYHNVLIKSNSYFEILNKDVMFRDLNSHSLVQIISVEHEILHVVTNNIEHIVILILKDGRIQYEVYNVSNGELVYSLQGIGNKKPSLLDMTFTNNYLIHGGYNDPIYKWKVF